jgi:hypothetical protein
MIYLEAQTVSGNILGISGLSKYLMEYIKHINLKKHELRMNRGRVEVSHPQMYNRLKPMENLFGEPVPER